MKSTVKALTIIILLSFPAWAYHPLDTEDPGTTEFRHFELEWGNYFIYPQDSLSEINGYLAIKGGLAPGLEFDSVVNFVYWLDLGEDEYTSGWGDVEMSLKYRFLGDGEEPFNMGMSLSATFPAGMSRIGQGGEYITPSVTLFGSVGVEKLRLLLMAGANFLPEEDDTMSYGGALELTLTEKLMLVSEIAGETDFEEGGGNDPARVGFGTVLRPLDWLTLSFAGHVGISPHADDFTLTIATLVGW